MEQNIFLQKYFKVIQHLYKLKKHIKYFSDSPRIDSLKFNVMLEKDIDNITKSECSFSSTFVDHNILPDINLNGHCLINNIHIPKKGCNYKYISYSKSMFKKSKRRYYIK